MADIPATHYVKSDDVHIAYQVIGDGPRDLLFVPGFVSNVEAIWQSPARASFFRRLATFARVITFDKRGTGMSDRGSQIFTLEQRMHDVQAVGRSDVAALCSDLSGAHVGPGALWHLRATLVGA
jgi:pimeloyl-ACP methyl ester carboxylesterase